MIEIELKVTPDEVAEQALIRGERIAGLRVAPRRTQSLRSVYYDTADLDLSRAGIALRLRKVGRGWIQTVKRKPADGGGGHGLFAHQEIEVAAPGGRLALNVPDETGVYAAIATAAGAAELAPVFETQVRRIIERLRTASGEVEIAIDRGSIIAGDRSEPIREVEIELVDGDVRAVFEVARAMFETGPLRFATQNKAARGYALARSDTPKDPLRARNAGVMRYGPDVPVETAARDVLRDCFAQIAHNMVVVTESDAQEGPHQLRVGLRRLRTAFAVFGPSLGPDSVAALSAEAKRLGQIVGGLRDLDVLIGEVVATHAGRGLDRPARAALIAALDERRSEVRASVRSALAAPDTLGFVLDLAQLIEARGWLTPSDYSQTERLATPLGALAPDVMRARSRKVTRKARGLRHLDDEELHDLRKELKTLRYTADILDPIYAEKGVKSFIEALKRLQDTFGGLNDMTMAAEYLTGPDAPGRADPDTQRAVGWVLGALSVSAPRDRPTLFKRWAQFEGIRPFWK